MNTIYTFLKSRVRVKKRRNTTSVELFEFTEPSVQVTTIDTLVEDESSDNQEPTSFLYALASSWAWEAVAFRCQSHPEEASSKHRDRSGDTLLHWTCFGSPPLHVVQALLQACPELATVQNYKKGSLPLHIACSYRASSEVVRALVKSYPDSVGIPDNAGSFATHILCDYGCSVESLRAVLETPGSASSVGRIDKVFRRTPLQMLNERKNFHEFHESLDELRKCRTRQRLLSRGKNLVASRADLDEMNSVIARLNEMAFWQKAKILVLSEHLGRSLKREDFENPGVVHAFIAIKSCPPSVLEFVVLLRAEELLLPDTNGQLPLHIAATVSDESTLCDVLSGQPDAACFHDRSRRLPLEIYLRRNSEVGWSGAVEQLISANPLALEGLDLDRRFYPLIWSKMISKKDINAVFETIRGNPSLLSENR